MSRVSNLAPALINLSATCMHLLAHEFSFSVTETLKPRGDGPSYEGPGAKENLNMPLLGSNVKSCHPKETRVTS